MPYLTIDEPYLTTEEPPIESQDFKSDRFFVLEGDESDIGNYLPYVIGGIGILGLLFLIRK